MLLPRKYDLMKRNRPSRSRGVKIVFFVLVMTLGLSALTAAALIRRAGGGSGSPSLPAAASTVQTPRGSRGFDLARRPEALKLGRRLGRRFLGAGREVSVLAGTLTTGADSRRVVIRRVRGEGGERVEVTLAGAGRLTWDAGQGALSAGRPADAETRAVVERLALDSADQFVLAQARGASYDTVARGARPDEGGSDGYAGPLYDLVRVGEPRREGDGGTASGWRLYYVNAATGLLEKVVSEEGGERIEAALSGWVERAGEFEPSSITWTSRGRTLMELTVTNVAHGRPAQ